MMKLFVYDHCPFCLRARMVFGLKRLPVQLIFLPNDDEATPVSMIGKKMVPVLQKDDGSYMAESLDIVHYVDQLDGAPLFSGQPSARVAQWLETVGGYVNRLLMPRFACAPLAEFTSPAAWDAFRRKKQQVIGDFDENQANSPDLLARLNQDLARLVDVLPGDQALSVDDILLFPLLRNLTLVENAKFPAAVAAYQRRLSSLTRINLLYPAV